MAAFLIGLLLKKAPTAAGKTALILGPILYACSRIPKWIMEGVHGFELDKLADGGRRVIAVVEGQDPQVVEGFAALYYRFCAMAFLHHMAIVFLILAVVMTIITLVKPRSAPVITMATTAGSCSACPTA